MLVNINKDELIREALGVDLQNLDQAATILVLLKKNQEVEAENKKLKKALNELTKGA